MNEQLNECADWHDDAASRLEAGIGTTCQSGDSSNESWAEQHRLWSKICRFAAALLVKSRPEIPEMTGVAGRFKVEGIQESQSGFQANKKGHENDI